MLVCKALLHDGENGSVYRLATPCENCDLAKFTAAETLCADVAMAKMHTFSLAFSTSFHRVRCDIRGHQIRLHRYGPRVGKQALLAILARANVVVLRETYDPNLTPPALNCAMYTIKHTPRMIVRPGNVVLMPHCGEPLANLAPLSSDRADAVGVVLLEHCLSALTDNAVPYVNVDIDPTNVVIDGDVVTVIDAEDLPAATDVDDVRRFGKIGVRELIHNPWATMLAQVCLVCATCVGAIPVRAMTAAFAHAENASVADVAKLTPRPYSTIAAALDANMSPGTTISVIRSVLRRLGAK